MNKRKMVFSCNIIWVQYQLESEEKCPENGSLNQNNCAKGRSPKKTVLPEPEPKPNDDLDLLHLAPSSALPKMTLKRSKVEVKIMIFLTHYPNWANIQTLTNTLLTQEECRVVLERPHLEAERLL